MEEDWNDRGNWRKIIIIIIIIIIILLTANG